MNIHIVSLFCQSEKRYKKKGKWWKIGNLCSGNLIMMTFDAIQVPTVNAQAVDRNKQIMQIHLPHSNIVVDIFQVNRECQKRRENVGHKSNRKFKHDDIYAIYSDDGGNVNFVSICLACRAYRVYEW